MSNTVPRPIQVDPDGTMDSRYYRRGDELVKGDKGDTGDIGPQGPQGEIGPQGEQGPQGPQGEVGPRGLQGIQGIQGVRGLTGANGTDGADGLVVSIVGVVADTVSLPPATSHPDGTGYLVGDAAPRALYVRVSDPSVEWINIGEVAAGPTGPKGSDGEEGPAGPQGEPGVDGEQGPQGEQGPIGPRGPQPPLGGSGFTAVAARVDHHHDLTYSPLGHNHDASYSDIDHDHSGVYSTAGHNHSISDMPSLQPALNNKANSNHTHPQSDVTGLVSALDGKANSGHNHNGEYVRVVSDGTTTVNPSHTVSVNSTQLTVTELTAGRAHIGVRSNVFADKSHLHSIADLPTLQPALNNKANSNHTHPASDITSGTLNKARIPFIPIAELFPLNKSVTGSGSFRVAPGNDHSVIATFGSTAVHDTGMRVSTDESWGYVFHHSWGFGWLPSSRL